MGCLKVRQHQVGGKKGGIFLELDWRISVAQHILG